MGIVMAILNAIGQVIIWLVWAALLVIEIGLRITYVGLKGIRAVNDAGERQVKKTAEKHQKKDHKIVKAGVKAGDTIKTGIRVVTDVTVKLAIQIVKWLRRIVGTGGVVGLIVSIALILMMLGSLTGAFTVFSSTKGTSWYKSYHGGDSSGIGTSSDGSSDSSSMTISAEGVGDSQFVKDMSGYAIGIANDDSHGYCQRRNGQLGRFGDPDYDCSSLMSASVEAACRKAGYDTGGLNIQGGVAFNTANEQDYLSKLVDKSGNPIFTIQSTSGMTLPNDLKPGDILWYNLSSGAAHTEMYLGNNQNVGAHHNENGGIDDGQPGDQTKDEISVSSFPNSQWQFVARYVGGDENG